MKYANQNVGQVSGLLSPFLEKWRLKKIAKWCYGNTILDCGCGRGEMLKYLPNISKYTGIDANKTIVENIKSSIKIFDIDTDFITVQLGKDRLTLKNNYDTIVMSAILEHLDNPEDVLFELKHFLTTNGIIIITTPLPKSEQILNIGSKFKIFSSEAFHEHKNHFSMESLTRLVDKVGLNIIHYEKFEFNLNQLIVLKQHEKKDEKTLSGDHYNLS